MAYKPDFDDYQQLREPITGRFDCSAWTGAWLVDAETGGKIKTTGRKIRLASSEPVPQPASPGLNFDQVDAAVRKVTKGKVDLGLHHSMFTDEAQRRIVDGRWAGVQVRRSVLVAAGFGGSSTFGGGHALTVHVEGDPTIPIIGDPLVRAYMRASWSVIWRAAGALVVDRNGHLMGQGRANVMFTKDVTADHVVEIRPEPGHRQAFRTFRVKNGEIVDRDIDHTRGFSAPCTRERFYHWDGHVGRTLVMLTGGSREGKFVNAKWSRPEHGA